MDNYETIDDVADLFEDAWRKGPARIEDFISKIPVGDEAKLFDELLRVECQILINRDQMPHWDDYLRRFPRFDAVVSNLRKQYDLNSEDAPLTFSDYELVEVIGEGGMGTVYKAFQKSLRRYVAIKLINNIDQPTAISRVFQEARAHARLKHPNIVDIYGIGRTPTGGYFIAMELVLADNLAKEIRRQPMTVDLAISIAVMISRTIEYAHSQGVLHRDLKPGNILYEGGGTIKIIDFGLAKFLDSAYQQLTAYDQAIGTAGYMAPEQIDRSRGKIDKPADIYAIGGVLYAMLMGCPPFSGETLGEIFQKILSDEQPVLPRTRRRDIPLLLESICLKCLKKDPADRYASAMEVAESLLQVKLETAPNIQEASGAKPTNDLQELTLPEQLVLLSRDNVTGKRLAIDGPPGYSSMSFFEKGLVGAIISELLYRGRITIHNKTIQLHSSQTTGDVILDRFLTIMSPSGMAIEDVICRLGDYTGTYEETILAQLVSRGILKKEVTYRLLIFQNVLYPPQEPRIKMQLVQRLVEAFASPSHNRFPWHMAALLAILSATNNWPLVAPYAGGNADLSALEGIFSSDDYIQMISGAVRAACIRVQHECDDYNANAGLLAS